MQKKGRLSMEQHEQKNHSLLVAAAANGDQNAYEALLKAYAPLLDSMSAAFAEALCDTDCRDDLRQEACIAFCRAVETFDCNQKEVQFGLYAKACIRNRLISCVRSMRKQEISLPLEELGLRDAKDPLVSLVEKEDYRELSRRIEAILSPYENRVWWLYLSGLTAGNIATRLQKDERSIQNAIYRIRKKLRASLTVHSS